MTDLSHTSASSIFGVDISAITAHVGLKELPTFRVTDQDSSIIYTGSWLNRQNREQYGDHDLNLHYSYTNDDFFSHTFEGTAIKYVGPKAHLLGDAEIFIDDVSQGIFIASKPAATSYDPEQLIFEISGLTAGKHTIKGVKLNGGYLTLDAFDITPNPVLHRLDQAIANLNTYRSTLGASQNRLEYAADNLTNIAQNTQAARSRIVDTDYASESTELARTQILQQAGTAMLAQANTQAQVVTSLLP